jgi:flagellar basal-body rod protein FlgF
MITGIYQSAMGMDALLKMQENTAQNLANISTTGFKKAWLEVASSGPTSQTVSTRVDLSSGSLQVTDNPNNLALSGDGYFTVETPAGTAYTRDGNFHLDNQGRLVTDKGYAVQGTRGDVVLEKNNFTVSENGDVIVDGNSVDRLAIASGSGPMQRVGGNCLEFVDPESVQVLDAENVHVQQGVLEGSNVSTVDSMVEIMNNVRLFEANQKALESQDETMQQAVSDVGKP